MTKQEIEIAEQFFKAGMQTGINVFVEILAKANGDLDKAKSILSGEIGQYSELINQEFIKTARQKDDASILKRLKNIRN